MENQQAEEGDIQIAPINSGQTMAIMAHSVRAVVGTFLKPEDSDEDKTKIALILFSTFLHQYIAVAKQPTLYVPILKATMDYFNAQPPTTPE